MQVRADTGGIRLVRDEGRGIQRLIFPLAFMMGHEEFRTLTKCDAQLSTEADSIRQSTKVPVDILTRSEPPRPIEYPVTLEAQEADRADRLWFSVGASDELATFNSSEGKKLYILLSLEFRRSSTIVLSLDLVWNQATEEFLLQEVTRAEKPIALLISVASLAIGLVYLLGWNEYINTNVHQSDFFLDPNWVSKALYAVAGFFGLSALMRLRTPARLGSFIHYPELDLPAWIAHFFGKTLPAAALTCLVLILIGSSWFFWSNKIPPDLDRAVLAIMDSQDQPISEDTTRIRLRGDERTLLVYCRKAVSSPETLSHELPPVGQVEFAGAAQPGRFVPRTYSLELSNLDVRRIPAKCLKDLPVDASRGLSTRVKFQFDGSFQTECVPVDMLPAIQRTFCGERGRVGRFIATLDGEGNEAVFRCSARPQLTQEELARALSTWSSDHDLNSEVSASFVRRYEAIVARLQEIYEEMELENGLGSEHRIPVDLMKTYYESYIPNLADEGTKERARRLVFMGAIARLTIQYKGTGDLSAQDTQALADDFRSYWEGQFNLAKDQLPSKNILRLYVRFFLHLQEHLDEDHAALLETAIQDTVKQFQLEGLAGYLEDFLRSQLYLAEKGTREENLRKRVQFFCDKAAIFTDGPQRFRVALQNAQINRGEKGQPVMPAPDLAHKIAPVLQELDETGLKPVFALDRVLRSITGYGCPITDDVQVATENGTKTAGTTATLGR